VLRIDVDGGLPYAIPPDNPFVDGDPSTLDEIWAYGLRNPFHFSFDRTTGDMYLGDVGQASWEEINFLPHDSTGGVNFGWRCYEGNQPFDVADCAAAQEMTFPIHAYDHSVGCSVTGGTVYRGARFPDLSGLYFFSDFCRSIFWSLARDAGENWRLTEFGALVPHMMPSVFGEDAAGEIYVTSAQPGATIYRIEATGPTATATGMSTVTPTPSPGESDLNGDGCGGDAFCHVRSCRNDSAAGRGPRRLYDRPSAWR
jgi:glucose/arabinose dehydrogenase